MNATKMPLVIGHIMSDSMNDQNDHIKMYSIATKEEMWLLRSLGRSNAGKPVCIDSIDDSYRSYGDWSHGTLDIDNSARSHPGFSLVRESNSFNEHCESLDISARTAPGFGIRRDSDIESSGSKKEIID
ncbi:hypothetical protein ACHAWO_003947 [Cyclotella atomus]|uniref:Uncharacterized protein n=1 Tax=Cyclotella atomus TaxID=382360 RepID=A0ABD3MTZ2_9STRA